MKKLLIAVGIILLIVLSFVCYRVHKRYVPGWGEATREIKREYPVVRNIYYARPYSPDILMIVVTLKEEITVEETGPIFNKLRTAIFSEKIWGGLVSYFMKYWNCDFSGIYIIFEYKDEEIYRISATVKDWDSWRVQYISTGNYEMYPYKHELVPD